MRFKKTIAGAASAVVAAGCAFGVVETTSLQSQIRAADSRTTTVSSRLRGEQNQLNGLASKYSQIAGTLATLSTPSDPLSAYDDICNQQTTNDATGIIQTYYYPCTNSAETIPQPGN
jgi:hypothetical protein